MTVVVMHGSDPWVPFGSVYWKGNAAKAFVIDRILTESNGKAVTIFDHGCGDAVSWRPILLENPNIWLVAWDPNRAKEAAANLAGTTAFVSGSQPHDVEADFVVSFSVLEHVRDRPRYLDDARRALAPKGYFYLNYDDGHFRDNFDLDNVRASVSAARNRLRTALARVSRSGDYQRRVTASEAETLIAAGGFTIEGDWYHNLTPFKWLSKVVDTDEFTRFWVETEERLNRDFSVHLPVAERGDSSALWQVCLSRTLLLRLA